MQQTFYSIVGPNGTALTSFCRISEQYPNSSHGRLEDNRSGGIRTAPGDVLRTTVEPASEQLQGELRRHQYSRLPNSSQGRLEDNSSVGIRTAPSGPRKTSV